ncbi:MAG TPA: hypothetical protein VK823_04445 [Streptosporangiaceae bacterium]|jgi:hypothetical protein|nr:hypothetical protein [Streptosporangiaceae bacterium]
MHSGEQFSSGPGLAGALGRPARPLEVRPGVGRDDPVPPAAQRWWIAAAWIAAGLALLGLLFRISLSVPQNSDGANNALQGWDILHGNLLLHSWILGDATYYTFELPLYAIAEIFTGLHSVTIHLVSALTYLIVTASAVAVGRADSRGLSAAARSGVVIAVLAAPLLTPSGVAVLLEEPDHIGTTAILLVCFLLINRAPGWRFTPPLLCAILIAGQVGDATVLYVAVPAILVVCAYRVVATVNIQTGVNIRRVLSIRTGDPAIAVAAAVSVPLAVLARAAIVHLGGYLMIPPRAEIAPPGLLEHHAVLALQGILTLFGAASQGAALRTVGAVFGLACLLAAACGFARVIWTWRTAGRAEQLLCAAIVINITVYVISSIPTPGDAWELAAVLPCGAVLAARAFVPGHIADPRRARVAIAAAAVVALLPLAAAATRPPAPPPAARLATWLQAHGLTYGIGGYWDASAVTVESGNRVQVRAVRLRRRGHPVRLAAYDWETNASWYDASQHDATFVIADLPHSYLNDDFTAALYEKYLPRPAAIYHVAGRVILVYRTNLLRHIVPALPLNHTRA